MANWVWMRNTETGGVQKFAAEAVDEWKRMGWEPAEPPAEPNLALDPNHPALVQQREAEAARVPAPAETTGDGTPPASKRSTGRASAADKEE